MIEATRQFREGLPFPLDPFQEEAIAALDHGRSVLVAAPTGAGKTVVADFACHAALLDGNRVFYTTPIKALSNQKHRDLGRTHGSDNVGLLTGDRSINGSAPIVVMTTEVLRNMLFTGSEALDGVQCVILDEVHYLGDWERGGVWEEVIVQLPQRVQLAALSATVSNAEEFGDWLAQVRETCDTVITEYRPVPLRHHYWVNDRIHDMFRTGGQAGQARRRAAREARAGKPNPDVLMLERQARESRAARGQHRRGKRVPRVRMRWPDRFDVVTELSRRGWLPAIIFVFSRAGCDKAVAELVAGGVRLTDRHEAEEIATIVDTMLADIPPGDLEVLDHASFRASLQAGIAPHHAGLIPAFKEAVEVCFQRGLLKVVVATETLALGINMPARTVVIERLEKWDGARHTLLTPGQYTQLTGRAGRRGIDDIGHAIVLHQRDVEFRRVAGLVRARSHPLTSTFRPSHNLVVNLLATHTMAESEAMLEASFAQYQANQQARADRDRLIDLRRRRQELGEVTCERGDWAEYAALQVAHRREQEHVRREQERARRRDVMELFERAQPGDVWVLPWIGRRGLALVVNARINRNGIPIVDVVADDRRLTRFRASDLEDPPHHWRSVDVPPGNPRNSAVRARMARLLDDLPEAPQSVDAGATPASVDQGLLREHPCHVCPDRPAHEKLQARIDRVTSKISETEEQIRRQTGSLVRQFDARVQLLIELGYLDDVPRPTDRGRLLAGIHSDVDIVVSEALQAGAFDGLDAAELAGVVSMFVHEARSDEVVDVWIPTGRMGRALDAIEDALAAAQAGHRTRGIPALRELDASFAPAAWRWARGGSLDDALVELDLTPGDFVRIVKQVIDLLSQLAHVAPAEIATTSRQAVTQLRRGIVDL
ncbi:MAG: DEAD/DEAH box helicase [Nitriliruptorales bacterium]|nr:DEAD/DEAH box helicase [Nitriliruptorales bacterium]